MLLRAVARPEEAVTLLQEAIDLRTSLIQAPDTTLAEWMTELAWEVRLAGDLPRAAALFSDALEIERQLRGPNHPVVATNLVGLAATYHDQGSFDEGERLFRSALDLGVASRPTPLAATVLLNLGMVRRLREQFVEAEQLLRSAVEMRRALYDSSHPAVLEASQQLGLALLGLGRLAEADTVLRQSLVAASETLGEEHHLTRGGREGLAGVDWEMGRFRTASARFDSVLAAKRRANGPDHSGNVFTLLTLGDVAVDAGQLEVASRSFAEAQAMRGRLGEAGGAYELLIAHGRARVALRRGERRATDSLLTYAIAQGDLRPDHRYVLEVQRTRARWLLGMDRAEEAETLLRQVLQSEEAARPRPHPRRGETLTLLAETRLAQGDRTAARALFERAERELTALPATHPKVRTVRAGLATAGPP
jgi:tetratricopeptide (TPR) repeat protein